MYENELNASEGTVVQSPPVSDEAAQNSANAGEVTEPQNSGANAEELAAPQIENMSDEEFQDYISSVKGGREPTSEGVSKTETADAAADAPDADAVNDRAIEEGERKEADADSKADEGETFFKTFKTQEDYQNSINAILGERLKASRESVQKLGRLSDLASSFYGEEGGKAIERLIEDLQSQNADKNGMDVETYRQYEQDAMDAKRYREQQQAQTDRETKIAEIRNRWNNESAELKKYVPDFDFANALKNQKFYNKVVNEGMNVSLAYYTSIYQRAEPKAEPKTEAKAEPKRREIPQNGNRTNGGVGAVQTNVSNMSDAEFIKYKEKIMSGG